MLLFSPSEVRNVANKEQGGNKNIKKVAKLSLKEKRALKREKRASQGGGSIPQTIIHNN